VTTTPRESLWRRDVLGWPLYDFANTIYSMNIVSLYLKRYLVEDLQRADYYFDLPFALSMLLAALLLPALGAMSDRSTKKKIFLLLFTLTCCSAVGLLAVVPAWMVFATMLLLVIANFSYEAGQPFYNALLYSVAEGRQARFVSGVGVALGYVGSIVGMALVLPFVTGDLFGIVIPGLSGGGKPAAFLPTAVLFMAFALPLFWWVREKPVSPPVEKTGLLAAYRDVWRALKETRRYPGVLRFLIADYFIEDAVATVIINMGVFCSVVIGLQEAQITVFLIISTASAVVGSFLIGHLARLWSLKRLLYVVVAGWVTVLALFTFVTSMTLVWVLGSLVGVFLGGLWTVSRPMLAELVPREELGKFFGLFALSGRAAAVVGPVIWTAVVYFLQPTRPLGKAVRAWFGADGPEEVKLPYQAAVLSLAVMMLIGLLILRKVPENGRSADVT